ncbi:uncharacterized protein LOC132260423 [Phlebotomus argentipes]|uniref:uncharacterized protein LOC132260423 n=1 Tax=Phlebotomus argentipes TaxID=94469 RepID=UPI00289361CC|nr:uncharacterized protein LOC132260423 [Phlebotomus argentipes]
MPEIPGFHVRNRVSQSLVGAWRNKLEFRAVFEGIYGRNSNDASKRKSLSRMKMWRGRLMSQTPASIMATLSVLEVSVKDAESGISARDLRTIYSTAIVRFLNYIHSTTRSSKSLYSVAKELGLASYVVDLRHLCSHGQTMPSLKTFRQVFSYCLQWLKSFYWEPQLRVMQDAKIADVKRNNKTVFENNLRTLFITYDGITEGLRKKKEYLGEICDENASREFLNCVGNASPDYKLSNLVKDILESIFNAVSAEQQVREIAQLFTEAFIDCDNLIKSPAIAAKEEEDSVSVTEIHQMLFRKIADWGFTPQCLIALLEIAENPQENEKRRSGTAFWCQRLIESFLAFQELKRVYKKNRDADPTISLDFSSINSHSVQRVVMEAYKEMGIDTETSLIFSDSHRRPWSLRFSRDFLKKRALAASEVTVKVLEICLQLADPPLEAQELDKFATMAKRVFSVAESQLPSSQEKIYTLEDVLGKCPNEKAESQGMGIWSETHPEINWGACPLGSVPFQQV